MHCHCRTTQEIGDFALLCPLATLTSALARGASHGDNDSEGRLSCETCETWQTRETWEKGALSSREISALRSSHEKRQRPLSSFRRHGASLSRTTLPVAIPHGHGHGPWPWPWLMAHAA